LLLKVEIKLEDVVEEEEEEEEEEQLFNFEIETNGSDVDLNLNGKNTNNNTNNNRNNNGNGVGGEALRNTLELKQLEISEMAEKLDSLMKLLFEYLRDLKMKEDNHIEATLGGELDEVFNLFLRLFDCAILNTHKSKYTQFLLFFLCQFKMHYTKCFLGYLLNKLADSNNHSLTRCTCAAYIGSFVSRSNNITLPILKSCLFELSKWAHHYLGKTRLVDTCFIITKQLSLIPSIHLIIIIFNKQKRSSWRLWSRRATTRYLLLRVPVDMLHLLLQT